MRRFLIGLFAVIGAVTVLIIATLAAGGWWFYRTWQAGPAFPDRFVLVADLRGSLTDEVPNPIIPAIDIEAKPTVSDVIVALDRGANDTRVAGLIGLVDDSRHGMAVAQELHDGIRRLRDNGKFALAFADSFGELTSGAEGYLIASAFEDITLQPVGLVGLNGIAVEIPFVKEFLNEIGISMDVGKREAYKTAFDSLTETGLTPQNHEMASAVLDSVLAQITATVAEGRGVDAGRARELVTGGPYTAEQSMSLGLVDHLGYRDQVFAEATNRAGTDALVDLEDYIRKSDRPEESAATIAFVRASGAIQRGSPEFGTGIGADDLAAALSDAIDAPDVQAILLRVNSPGGSAVASETIAREVRRAVATRKPVVVSMSNVAASGGYWISMAASRIVAEPSTLTGSIGVIAGKPVLAGLWDKLNVNWASIVRGETADMWSLNKPFGPEERRRLDLILDDLYGQFLKGVAAGRDMSVESVEAVAKGRVWTGAQAEQLGLVDKTGGLYEAMAELRDLLGLPEDALLRLEPYPPEQTPLTKALEFLMHRLDALARFGSMLSGVLAPGTVRMTPISLH